MFEVSDIEDLEGMTALAREWGDLVGEPAADRVCGVPRVYSRPERHRSRLEQFAFELREGAALSQTLSRQGNDFPGPSFHLQNAIKEYAQIPPAKPHVSMPMEPGCASGWRGFDFLQSGEPCRPSWARRRIRCLNLVAGVDGGGFKYSWHARWRGQAKAALGPAANTLKRMSHTSQRTAA